MKSIINISYEENEECNDSIFKIYRSIKRHKIKDLKIKITSSLHNGKLKKENIFSQIKENIYNNKYQVYTVEQLMSIYNISNRTVRRYMLDLATNNNLELQIIKNKQTRILVLGINKKIIRIYEEVINK